MIVLGLAAVAIALSAPMLGQFLQNNQHKTAVETVVQSLRNAGTFAQTGNEYVGLALREGVRFRAVRNSDARSAQGCSGIYFAAQYNDTGFDVCHLCGSGLPLQGAQTMYVVDKKAGKTTTIYLDANGGLSIQDGSGSSIVPGGVGGDKSA